MQPLLNKGNGIHSTDRMFCLHWILNLIVWLVSGTMSIQLYLVKQIIMLGICSMKEVRPEDWMLRLVPDL